MVEKEKAKDFKSNNPNSSRNWTTFEAKDNSCLVAHEDHLYRIETCVKRVVKRNFDYFSDEQRTQVYEMNNNVTWRKKDHI